MLTGQPVLDLKDNTFDLDSLNDVFIQVDYWSYLSHALCIKVGSVARAHFVGYSPLDIC